MKGVYYRKGRKNPYEARVSMDGFSYNLGLFQTFKKAAMAALNFRITYYKIKLDNIKAMKELPRTPIEVIKK